jgi:hypothetical protein
MLKFSKNDNKNNSKSKTFVKENRECIDDSVEEGVKCKHKNLLQKNIYIYIYIYIYNEALDKLLKCMWRAPYK